MYLAFSIIVVLSLVGGVLILYGSLKKKTPENQILFQFLPIGYVLVFLCGIIAVPIGGEDEYLAMQITTSIVEVLTIALTLVLTSQSLKEGMRLKHPFLLLTAFLPGLWVLSNYTAMWGFPVYATAEISILIVAVVVFILVRKMVRAGKSKRNHEPEESL